MHGGDSLFGKMTSVTHTVYRDSGLDPELDHRAHKVTEKLSDSINTIANEPSVAFYRIQEHVRKTLPQLVEDKHEVEEIQQLVQGACFDTEYAGNAVRMMQKSTVHFQNIQELLKNAMFMKQQIDYEESRKRGRSPAGGPRVDGPAGGRTDDGASEMGDSAVSTDSSLAASTHANTEASNGTSSEGLAVTQQVKDFNIQTAEEATEINESGAPALETSARVRQQASEITHVTQAASENIKVTQKEASENANVTQQASETTNVTQGASENTNITEDEASENKNVTQQEASENTKVTQREASENTNLILQEVSEYKNVEALENVDIENPKETPDLDKADPVFQTSVPAVPDASAVLENPSPSAGTYAEITSDD